MKFKKYLLFLLVLVLIPVKAKAISITSMYCSPSEVTSGDDFTATITVNASEEGYWQKDGGLIGSSNLRSNGGTDSIWEEATSSVTITHSFKALDPGTGTIYFTAKLSDFTGDNEIEASASCSITINAREVPSTPSSPESANVSGATSNNNSSNNSNTTNKKGSSDSTLKSLSVDKGKINPTFDPESFDYSLSVNNDVDKITISGEKNNDNASVEGLGEKELQVGVNKFEIKVTSENGESRTYTLTVTRKEKGAIEITINKKKYTVIKKEGILNPPEGFVKTNVIIEKQEVVAYSNEYTGYIIVGLIDDVGKANWYIYNSKNSTYTKYNEVTSKGLRLVIIDAPKSKIPSGYKKTTLELYDGEVTGYTKAGIKNFKLVYAINMANGDESFYQYDEIEKTYQRYNKDLAKSYDSEIQLFELIIVGAAALILIMFIIMLAISSSNRKLKKGLKHIKEDRTIDRLVKEEKIRKEISKKRKEEPKYEEPTVEPEPEVEPTVEPEIEPEVQTEVEPEVEESTEEEHTVLSKKELKRLRKEEKRKLKEMQDDFLNN